MDLETPRVPAQRYYSEPDTAAWPAGGLVEYTRIVRRRKHDILALTCVGALSAVLLTLPQTRLYQAHASIEVQSLNEDFLNIRNIRPTTDTAALSYPEYDVQTQIRVLQSRSLAERVVNNLSKTNPAPPAAALAFTAGTVRARGQANTRVIDITCDSKDPKLAAGFANALASELIENNLEARWKATQTTGEWLTRQMESVRIKLEKSEEQLQGYARAAGLLFTGEKDNVSEERLHQLQGELSKAQAARVAAQSKFEMSAGTLPQSLPEVLDDSSLRDAQSKLNDLRRQAAELSATFTPEYPKVKRVQAQIAALETSLESERANILRRIHNDYESARRREDLLSAGYAEQARRMAAQANDVAHYLILKREVDTNRQLYDSMLQRVKEAGVASALRASNIRVIDQALPPALPYKPNLLHNTLAGVVIGLFCGTALIVTRDRANRRLREPGDAQLFAGVQELGTIPSARTGRAALPIRMVIRRLKGHAGHLEAARRPQKPSAIAESFRAAVSSILLAPPGADRPQLIVISSPSPQEGKTTVTANAAVALAEIGFRVLAIDADLRQPRLHEAFQFANDRGLVDLLRSGDPLAPMLAALVRPGAVPGLRILTSGAATFADTALLYSARLAGMLAYVRAEYDVILLDTPPMETMADARVLGRLSDGVVLVTRANRTAREGFEAACKRFSEDGTRVLGTILNDWNAGKLGRDYRRYYEEARV